MYTALEHTKTQLAHPGGPGKKGRKTVVVWWLTVAASKCLQTQCFDTVGWASGRAFSL